MYWIRPSGLELPVRNSRIGSGVPALVAGLTLVMVSTGGGPGPLGGRLDGERGGSDGGHLSSFAVRYQDIESRHAINLASVLPGETLHVTVVSEEPGSFDLESVRGSVRRIDQRTWDWIAPDSTGGAMLTITNPDGSDSILIQAFVLVPYAKVAGGVLNGYRIGRYPKAPLRDIYRAPRGLIEITPENAETLVSPHFRLRQFVCKQAGGYPKYMVLEPDLLLKLEVILQRVNDAGYDANSLFVMSGYRTPFYNQAIGNSEWSRHKWGAAVDIFIDENPRDGTMDDLNGDGRIDVKDAEVLAAIIDAESDKPYWRRFLGGLGIYRTNANHGPFVHIDIRGRKHRWRSK